MAALVRLARGDARDLESRSFPWADLAQAAFEHGMLPKLAPLLLSHIPPGAEQAALRAQEQLRWNARRCLAIATESARLVGELEAGGIPAALFILVVGTALAWATGLAPSGSWSDASLGWRPPLPAAADLWRGLHVGGILPYLSVVVPMGLLDLLASLQCIESAAAAGDSYSTPASLAANGLCTIAAACFGSPFPTSIYIGHPAWKRMGARAGYSTANAIFVTVVCLTGAMALMVWAVPPDAGLAIMIWIGLIITIQAFEATDQRHWPAVLMGMVPVILAWVTFGMKTATRIGAGTGTVAFSPALVSRFHQAGFAIEGGFALEQGTFCCALILSAVTVFIIDRKFITAAAWSASAAVLSVLGLLHAWKFQPNDTVGTLPLLERLAGTAAAGTALVPAAGFAIGYASLAAVLLLVRVFAEPDPRQAG